MIKAAVTSLTLVVSISVIAGCGVTRGIPSHGGGKRFLEEQRAVACAVRRSVSGMDLHELSGKEVQLVVKNLAHSGNGVMTWPGPETINLRADTRNTTYDNARTNIGPNGFFDDNTSDTWGAGASMNYRLQSRYSPYTVSTNEDINYLRAALEMKAAHNGLRATAQVAPIVLNVLVDVLGTNRSRHDKVFHVHDELVAACEITYYAVDRASGTLLFKARRTAAEASYREVRLRGLDQLEVTRETHKTEPTPMPVDGKQLRRDD